MDSLIIPSLKSICSRSNIIVGGVFRKQIERRVEQRAQESLSSTKNSIRKAQFGHLEPVPEMIHRTGGLTFNAPNFCGKSDYLVCPSTESDQARLDGCLEGHQQNPVYTQGGQECKSFHGARKARPNTVW